MNDCIAGHDEHFPARPRCLWPARLAVSCCLLAAGLSCTAAAVPALDEARVAERVSREYAAVVRGLAADPDIRVVPVLLAAGEMRAELAASTFRPIRVAMAEGLGSIAVVYPDIGEPYRSIFAQIIEGIEARTKSNVASYAIGPDIGTAELNGLLRRQGARVVIALGRQGMQAARALGQDYGVIGGGVLSAPEEERRGMSVITLSPAPALLFAQLRNLAPEMRRVHVVYDPRQNGWMMKLARDAAREQRLELVAHEATDLKGAVRLYQETLAGADPATDALWLPSDPTTVEEGTVLPMVLQEAWNRNLLVFSSSVGHVRRGVLFSLYPDNPGLGRELASSALAMLGAGDAAVRGIAPLRNVLAAINLRTAKHLGLNLSSQQQRNFDMVFSGQ